MDRDVGRTIAHGEVQRGALEARQLAKGAPAVGRDADVVDVYPWWWRGGWAPGERVKEEKSSGPRGPDHLRERCHGKKKDETSRKHPTKKN